MLLKTRQIDNSFALEILDVRLWEPSSRDTLDALRDLWPRLACSSFAGRH